MAMSIGLKNKTVH